MCVVYGIAKLRPTRQRYFCEYRINVSETESRKRVQAVKRSAKKPFSAARNSLTFRPIAAICADGRPCAAFPFSSEINMDCHPRRGLAACKDSQALENQVSYRVRSRMACG